MVSRVKAAYRENRRDVIIVIIGLVFLIVSVPTFLFYNIFPTISSEIGPHQISSWLSVTFSFVGFGMILFGMGKLDI
ncbi:MAG: hypothetical protein B2I17_09325 [Thermoplasmatales archaeon B_DKE]|nr:MAG: hypothetical protein B2I17_09325 [Thermoplasmatales archaeon B_DKE]